MSLVSFRKSMRKSKSKSASASASASPSASPSPSASASASPHFSVNKTIKRKLTPLSNIASVLSSIGDKFKDGASRSMSMSMSKETTFFIDKKGCKCTATTEVENDDTPVYTIKTQCKDDSKPSTKTYKTKSAFDKAIKSLKPKTPSPLNSLFNSPASSSRSRSRSRSHSKSKSSSASIFDH